MKQNLTNVFGVIGVLAVMFGGCVALSKGLLPSYAERMKREFGSPEAIADLVRFYSVVETKGARDLPVLKSDPDITLPVSERARRMRNIPKSWLPARFSQRWGSHSEAAAFIEHNDVVAYYDERDVLIGLGFLGSRCGCFVSRDPMRCPEWFGSLRRLATEPLFVTSWVGEVLE